MRSEARMRMDRHLAFEGRRPKSALFADETAKGTSRKDSEQISGTIPPVMQALLDLAAEIEGMTKQDMFAVCVNRVMREYGAVWAPPSDELKRITCEQAVTEYVEGEAKKVRNKVLEDWCRENGKDFRTESRRRGGIQRLLDEYLDAVSKGDPDARTEAEDRLIDLMDEAVAAIPEETLEEKRKVRLAAFESKYSGRVGKPFELPLNGSTSIGLDKAMKRADARIRFQSMLDEAGFEDLDAESRKRVVADVYRTAGADIRDFMVTRGWVDAQGTPLRSERTQLAPSREGKRPFCAWFKSDYTQEFSRLVAHGLGGATTSKQRVVEAGVFQVILDQAAEIRKLSAAADGKKGRRVMTETELKALDVIEKSAEIGDVSLAVGLLAKPEPEWKEWLSKPTAPRLRRLAGKV